MLARRGVGPVARRARAGGRTVQAHVKAPAGPVGDVADAPVAAAAASVRQVIPTRVRADSFRAFQTGASQIPWRRTGGSPCGQGLPFVRTMTRPSFGP